MRLLADLFRPKLHVPPHLHRDARPKRCLTSVRVGWAVPRIPKPKERRR